MTQYNIEKARETLTSGGWLSFQTPQFREEILSRGFIQYYPPGSTVYRYGDELGGIYGMISGAVAVTTAPPTSLPKLVHMGRPGGWTGEGCFLTRRPRRLGLHCILDTWLFHVPLNVLDEMAAKDPNVIRYISQILLLNSDMLVHVVHDLQIPQAERRIAAILWRTAFHGNQAVPLSQEEIGAMSNTSRKQVNAALRKFAELGWVTASYRQVTVENAAALNAFAKEED